MESDEKDYLSHYNLIMRQYNVSPFGFRLRKTGKNIKLFEMNGLLYLSDINLRRVLHEVLGTNLPDDFEDFLNKVVFTEDITISTKQGIEMHPLTCTQFLDDKFFEKCKEWLNNRPEIYFKDDVKIDPTYGIITKAKKRDDIPKIEIIDSTGGKLDDLYPFKNPIGEIIYQEFSNPKDISNTKSAPSSPGGGYIIRPRGKYMDDIPQNPVDRPFICDDPFCNRSFKRHEHLKRHMKMHSGERPFQCSYPGCYKSFSRSDNLNQHYRTHNVRMDQNNQYHLE